MKRWFLFFPLMLFWFASFVRAADYTWSDYPLSSLSAHGPSMGFLTNLSSGGPFDETLGTYLLRYKNSTTGGPFVDILSQRIGWIDPNGRITYIAGQRGVIGYRDGPGEQALFDMNGAGYPNGALAMDSKGSLYFTSGNQQTIRKIYKQTDGTWYVTTVAGQGTQTLSVGQTGSAMQVAVGGATFMVMDLNDNIWYFGAGYLLYKYDTKAATITAYDSSVPLSHASPPGSALTITNGGADRIGNVYFGDRQDVAMVFYKVDAATGKISYLAGINRDQWNSYLNAGLPVPVDGPTSNASFFVGMISGVEPDGSAIYVSGGDETMLRRIKDGRVSSLMPDLTFQETNDRRASGMSYDNPNSYVSGVTGPDSQHNLFTYNYGYITAASWHEFRVLSPIGTPTTPGNQLPSAFIQTSATSGNSPLTVNFIGSGNDPDGTLVSYSWNFGDGATSNAQNPSHQFITGGSFIVSLTVTDNSGGQAISYVTIQVASAQSPSPPTPSVPAPILDISSASNQIPYNSSGFFSWSSQSADSCAASGAWSGTKPTSGNYATGNITSNQTYALSCTNATGTVTRSVTFTIQITGSTTSSDAPQPDDHITITEKSGATQTNYPVQIGRPFRTGEIKNYPQAVLNGTPLLTQADVKTRWPDGSVKHAILSFVLPTLAGNSSITITFQDQSSGGAASGKMPPLTGVSVDFAGLGTAFCDQMRSKATLWLDGPVATSWILADHLTKSFDIGVIRPICEVTQWHSIGNTFVRFIAESSDTEKQNDITYNVTVQPSGEASSVYQQAATRWTRTFWLGTAPSEKVNIDHNLAYLASTGAVPNFDSSKLVSEAAIADGYSQWLNSSRGFNGTGNWTTAMGTGGGRPDIGPYPSWITRWLYTGDYRMQEQSLGNADLAGEWPMQYREGNSAKSAYGDPIRITDRPTLALVAGLNYSYTTPEDRITPLAQIDVSAWRPDISHQPDPYSIPYMLTGDYWYLEQASFWASWSAAYPNGAAISSACGRGPTGKEGGIPGMQCITMRGQAWAIRSRAQIAWLMPDNMSAEKNYYTQLVREAICIWEGGRRITGTACENSANWIWGRDVDQPSGAHPMNFWEPGNGAFVQANVDPTKASAALSTWEQNFVMYSLGRLKELGFPSDALLNWLGQNIAGQITGSGTNPYIIAAYRSPTKDTNGNYFTDWQGVVGGYIADPANANYVDLQANFNSTMQNGDHGYANVAIPAIAASGNAEAWNWAKTNNEAINPTLIDNPKWAIVPRGQAVSYTYGSTAISISDPVFSAAPQNPGNTGSINTGTTGDAGTGTTGTGTTGTGTTGTGTTGTGNGGTETNTGTTQPGGNTRHTLRTTVVNKVSSGGSASGIVVSDPTGINCGTVCTKTYAAGTIVNLRAVAGPNSKFSGWTGDRDCSDGSVTMNANKTCTAKFELNSVTITVSKNGNGTVASTPTGITCGAVCSYRFAGGTSVTLRATPNPGFIFSGWSGACIGTSDCTVTLTSAATITANFFNGLNDKIGVYRPATGEWFLDSNGNGSWDGCGVDICLQPFAGTSGVPVVGDWDGSGASKLGLFVPASAEWLLDMNGNGVWDGCRTDACIKSFGKATDISVVGQWTNNAHDRIGIFRPAIKRWHLDSNGNGVLERCTIDKCIVLDFYENGDIPVVGDWTGRGSSQVGFFRPSTGQWFLYRDGNREWESCRKEICISSFGQSGDIPVTGDWNGTGVSKIGVFRPSTSEWFLDLNGNGKWDGPHIDTYIPAYGQPGDIPVVGKW